jgi:hypothetical protein
MGTGTNNVLILENNRFIETEKTGKIENDENDENDEKIKEVLDKYEVKLEKPLRCASYYKVDDLKEIARQLHLPIENMKKQQLYDSIHNILIKLE